MTGRGALLALWLAAGLATPAAAWKYVAAEYRPRAAPSEDFAYGEIDRGILVLTVEFRTDNRTGLFVGTRSLEYELNPDPGMFFKGPDPALWDVTGDGQPEAVMVQGHVDFGTRLLIMGLDGRRPVHVADTPFVWDAGHRLAPHAAGDLDGSGTRLIAVVADPHDAPVLHVWRFDDGAFYERFTLPGLTNHRAGDTQITGGQRDCGAGPELVMVLADWSEVVVVRMTETRISGRGIAPYSPEAMAAAMACAED